MSSGLIVCAALAAFSVLAVFFGTLFISRLLEGPQRIRPDTVGQETTVECRHVSHTFPAEKQGRAHVRRQRTCPSAGVVVKPMNVSVVFEREEWASPKPVTVIRPRAAWN